MFKVVITDVLIMKMEQGSQQHTDKVGDWLVNTVELLAAKETDISLGSW